MDALLVLLLLSAMIGMVMNELSPGPTHDLWWLDVAITCGISVIYWLVAMGVSLMFGWPIGAGTYLIALAMTIIGSGMTVLNRFDGQQEEE